MPIPQVPTVWTVWRRYSAIFSLSEELRKQNDIVRLSFY